MQQHSHHLRLLHLLLLLPPPPLHLLADRNNRFQQPTASSAML